MSGGSIVDAKAFTTSDGFALDVFSVQDTEGDAFGDPDRMERLRQTIEKTLRGRNLAARAPRPRGPAQPRQRLQDPAQGAFRQRGLAASPP